MSRSTRSPTSTSADASRASSPVLDPATRTAQIEVEINNAQFRLKPGMYAKVDFTVERHDNALIVPANAVVDYEGKKGVFMPGGEGDQAHFQAVQLGLIAQDQIEITSGLAEGDKVVTDGRRRAARRRPHPAAGPERRRTRRPGRPRRPAAATAAPAQGRRPAGRRPATGTGMKH